MNIETIKFAPLESRPIVGVYMLILNGRIQYVGQSVDVASRITFHRRLGKVRFDSVKTAKVAVEMLHETERALIVKHRPPHNFACTPKVHEPRKPTRKPSTNLTIAPSALRIAAMIAEQDHRPSIVNTLESLVVEEGKRRGLVEK